MLAKIEVHDHGQFQSHPKQTTIWKLVVKTPGGDPSIHFVKRWKTC